MNSKTSSTLRQSSSRYIDVPELLTAKDLEALLKIDVKTIYSYVQRGLIPYVKIQSNIRFWKHEIQDWLEHHTYRLRPVNDNGSTRHR